MQWPSIAALSSGLSLPAGVELSQLTVAELEALPALIRAWYPAVTVGAESVFLDVSFLVREVAHEGHDADIFAFTIRQEGGDGGGEPAFGAAVDPTLSSPTERGDCWHP